MDHPRGKVVIGRILLFAVTCFVVATIVLLVFGGRGG